MTFMTLVLVIFLGSFFIGLLLFPVFLHLRRQKMLDKLFKAEGEDDV